MTRDELVEELRELKIYPASDALGEYATEEQLGDIADFIIKRERKILSPLIELVKKRHETDIETGFAINKTLSLSCIERKE